MCHSLYLLNQASWFSLSWKKIMINVPKTTSMRGYESRKVEDSSMDITGFNSSIYKSNEKEMNRN